MDIQELKRKAEAATPGEWITFHDKLNPPEIQWCVRVDNSVFICDFMDNGGAPSQNWGKVNAKFVAAANPQTILSLIAEIESLRKQLEEAKSGWNIAANACTLALAEQHKLKHDLSALRSSREKEIERAINAAVSKCDEYSKTPILLYMPEVRAAVLAQLKGENNG